jgi:hypothetical protein
MADADNKEVVVQKNPLEMSDEELMALSHEEVTAMTATLPDGAETKKDAGAEGDGASVVDSASEGKDDGESGDPDNKATDSVVVVPPVTADAKVDDADNKANDADKGTVKVVPDAADKGKEADKPADAKADPASKAAPDVKADEPAKVIDYKAEYERLTGGFKANGRDFKVESVDDAIALMQMGANYNKKMSALKPNLKLMKLLENNGLLSEEKLGFLIDLSNKNPEAINKLVKDSGIDPLDLTADKAKAYKPGSHTVSDQEMELDTVLDELKDSQHYGRTLEVVSSKWDGASKQLIAEQPQILKVINGHMENGIYDLVAAEVERERTFGRLTGLTDLQAYQKVGDAMNERGGFNHLASKAIDTKAAPAPIIVQPKPKQEEDPSLKDKKRAASAAKPAAPAAAVAKDFNPLALSDAEFEKQAQAKFL